MSITKATKNSRILFNNILGFKQIHKGVNYDIYTKRYHNKTTKTTTVYTITFFKNGSYNSSYIRIDTKSKDESKNITNVLSDTRVENSNIEEIYKEFKYNMITCSDADEFFRYDDNKRIMNKVRSAQRDKKINYLLNKNNDTHDF